MQSFYLEVMNYNNPFRNFVSGLKVQISLDT